jgi:hypothetical protein
MEALLIASINEIESRYQVSAVSGITRSPIFSAPGR